jgi:spermidine synthase
LRGDWNPAPSGITSDLQGEQCLSFPVVKSKAPIHFSQEHCMASRRAEARLYLFGLIFFISGIAGLIYEVVWERLLELYFGVNNVSITLIVSAYMAGLGLGSLLGGRLSNRTRVPLVIYGLVELGIALFGVFSPSLIIWIGSATAGVPYWLVFLVSFGILLIPTFLMGMTLPLLAQAFVSRVEQAGTIVGLLYGINTLGAALGAILAGYLFIGWVGLASSVYIGCALNALAGFSALAINRFRSTRSPSAAQADSPVKKQPPGQHLPAYLTIILISFVVGFIGLGYEMLWLRMLAIVNKNTVYGFPTVLGVFLIGLALGGYYFGRKADTVSDAFRLFWKLEIAAALAAGLGVWIYWHALGWEPVRAALQTVFRDAQRPVPGFVLAGHAYIFSRRQFVLGMVFYLLPVLWLVLPASFLLGGGLPVLDRIAIRNAQLAGRWVGNVHVANILGSVAGTLLVSFVLLDRLGSEWTLRFLVLLSAGFVLVAWQGGDGIRLRGHRAEGSAILGVVLLALLLPGNKAFYMRYFQAGTGTSAPIVEEYADGVLALTDNFLWIKGDEHGSYPSDGSYEHNVLACLGAAHPKRVLIIGLGAGNSAYFISKVPGINEIVIVELMEGLKGFLNAHAAIVREMLTDARLHYITDDGRRYLYANPDEKFDLISIDPLRNYSAGHDSLYSQEALRLYRLHLTEGGVLCEWQDENNLIPHTTAQVFPEVDSFRSFTVAGDHPIRYDVEFMNAIIAQYFLSAEDSLQKDAGEHLNTNKILLSFARSRSQILADEAATPVLTDLTPWLEYYLFRRPVYNPVRTTYEDLSAFITRLDGCDALCLEAELQRADKLK